MVSGTRAGQYVEHAEAITNLSYLKSGFDICTGVISDRTLN
jgi:hypothetical protein